MRLSNYKNSKWLMLAIVVLVFISCSEKEKFFERGKLVLTDEEKRDYEELEPLQGNDINSTYHFIQKDKTTYRSKIYKINGSRSFIFKSNLKGDVSVYFSIGQFKKNPDPDLIIKVTQNSGGEKKLLQEYSHIKNTVKFSRTLKLTGSSNISVDIKGNTQIFVTEPVFIKARIKNPVFLILADTLRADHLGTYGHKGKVSRNLTAFSEDCAVFDNCFSTTSWTLPAHISLFTGRNIDNHGVYSKHFRLSEEIPVLTESISKNRYALSFNEGAFVQYKYGFFRGFDTYSSKVWRASVFSKRMFENIVRLLKRKGFENIFSFLHTYQVHSPFRLHPGLEHSDSAETENATFSFSFPYKLAGHERKFTYRPRTEKQKKGIVASYDAELEFFDHWFGNFISSLKEMGIYKRSLIVFLSDHGEEFFDHKTWGHGNNLYNETIHIPLLIKFPENIHKGKRISQNCSITDVMPTILDFLNIDHEFEIDGISLLPVIENPDNFENNRDIRSLLIHTGSKEKLAQVPQMISIISGKYKLIYNFRYSDDMNRFYTEYPLPEYREYELYDLESDFTERNDLSEDPGMESIFEELKKKIKLIKRDVFAAKVKGIPLKITDKDRERLKTLGYL